MSESKNRLTFKQACQELQISEEQLERLVASGEIVSVKEGDSFFFKPEVVAQFKKGRKTEPTIILSDDEMDLLDNVEEISLDDLELPEEVEFPQEAESVVEVEASGGTDVLSDVELSMGEEELELEDLELPEVSLDDEGGDEPDLTLEDDALEFPAGEGADDTVLNLEGLLEEDDSGSESTTPVPGTDIGELELEGDDITLEGSVSEDTILDTDVLELTDEDDFQLDADAEEELTAEATASTLIRGGGARVMQMKRVKNHALWTFFLLLTSLVMFVPIAVMINLCFFDGVHPKPVPGRAPAWITDANFMEGAVGPLADEVHKLTGDG